MANKNLRHTTLNFPTTVLKRYKKLADYLWALPKSYKHFDMNSFCVKGEIWIDSYDGAVYKDSTEVDPHEAARVLQTNHCGTAACAVGHAPTAGCGNPLKGEEWSEYTDRIFMTDYCEDNNNDVWEWCFDGDWTHVDDTPKGAARRIYYMLEHGVPTNYLDQKVGCVPLSYTKQKPVEV